MPRPVYVTGHRNPDTDSIAAAIGYAELRNRLDPNTEYVPVRLGDLSAQTQWVLERSGADEPRHLPHVLLRVRDVMHEGFERADADAAVREVGLAMAREGLDLIPVVDGEDLAGVMTERALARRYIRESQETSSLVDAPTRVETIAATMGGEVLVGEDASVAGRVWVYAADIDWDASVIGPGDVVVVGAREDVQRRLMEAGIALLVLSNEARPSDAMLELAREKGTAIVVSPLDSYVSGRMITLAAPVRNLMDAEPLTVRPDDLVGDVAELVKDVHYRAAVAVDREGRPIGLVTRTDLVAPEPRRVLLVDHAEQAQSVPGIEEAEIVEILDHHHIGSIETRVPVRATFDPVGSTATLVVERFRQNGMEPTRTTATALLCAVLSDTVILNSPTTTERDHAVVEYLERVLAVDARALGREMFESGSDIAQAPADEIVNLDVKEYEVGPATVAIGQVETVGQALHDRTDELLHALQHCHQRNARALSALMVTDVLDHSTRLLVVGDRGAAERAFGDDVVDGVVDLPGVMSRKKQVAPVLLKVL